MIEATVFATFFLLGVVCCVTVIISEKKFPRELFGLFGWTLFMFGLLVSCFLFV